ncbi:winged helix-turn-helix domain-containing protein [Streptomyces malaysiensis subsp. malaysiensis]|uniref:GntR family transcriptional regulator n=1 Tax=Streptomyces malaysiensis TaxID=92644 RepID=A0ABX6W795_STRMQ|nr:MULTISPECIES: GntR family transcriptional regulator [Streptomyces]MBD3011363.1 GntR family transcriptional regulator [Streptomyces sp. 5-10]QPI57348.1 GntR family transcriptional regulator [Streptomyces solisilvae]UHH18897.1 GntR family transcriptional regulator [Streptomyces sp. HNM0561]
MTPSTHDARPPYQQAAEAIRAEIKAGKLKPGEQLPSHRELQERFGIANMTARSALRVLREEGLIYTVQGRGSYVADVIGPGGELIETAGTGEAPASAEPTGTLTEALLEVRDQLRSLNAEVQTLKQEVAELKARQHP